MTHPILATLLGAVLSATALAQAPVISDEARKQQLFEARMQAVIDRALREERHRLEASGAEGQRLRFDEAMRRRELVEEITARMPSPQQIASELADELERRELSLPPAPPPEFIDLTSPNFDPQKAAEIALRPTSQQQIERARFYRSHGVAYTLDAGGRVVPKQARFLDNGYADMASVAAIDVALEHGRPGSKQHAKEKAARPNQGGTIIRGDTVITVPPSPPPAK